MSRAWGLLAGLVAALVVPASAGALTLEQVGTYSGPVFVTSDPSDEDRLFVVEQGGTIKLTEGGTTSTFLDLTASEPDLVLTGHSERGLFSMAFAPDFESSGHFYVYYTRNGTGDEVGDLQIDEFTATGDTAALATRRPVLSIEHSSAASHNGGQLQLGPDDYLYIATGDGDNPNDPDDNAQDLDSLLGKVLRIDPGQDGANPYSIPPDNPFVGTAGADEVWSYGLRNPWRFSFDRLTGDMFIGDVGNLAWEEIDYAPAPAAGKGANFGWDCREGSHPGGAPSPDCPATGFTDPILEYENPAAGLAAVVGGYVVRDSSLGKLYGRYLYADTYGALGGEIRSLSPALPAAIDDRSEGVPIDVPSSFGEDAAGRLYVTSLSTGAVYRLEGQDLAARKCKGIPATVVASTGTTVGTTGDDVIVGGPKRHQINAKGGDDLVCAGGGRDRVRGGAGADELRGGLGRDRCIGGPGADRKRSC